MYEHWLKVGVSTGDLKGGAKDLGTYELRHFV